jgi:hypothetical protein
VWGHKHPKAGEEVEALKVAVGKIKKAQEVLLKLEHAAKEEKLEAWRIKMQKGVVEVRKEERKCNNASHKEERPNKGNAPGGT